MKRSFWRLSALAFVVAMGLVVVGQVRPTEKDPTDAGPVSDAPLWEPQGSETATTAPEVVLVHGVESPDLGPGARRASLDGVTIPAGDAAFEPPVMSFSPPGTQTAEANEIPEGPGGIDFREFEDLTEPVAQNAAPLETPAEEELQTTAAEKSDGAAQLEPAAEAEAENGAAQAASEAPEDLELDSEMVLAQFDADPAEFDEPVPAQAGELPNGSDFVSELASEQPNTAASTDGAELQAAPDHAISQTAGSEDTFPLDDGAEQVPFGSPGPALGPEAGLPDEAGITDPQLPQPNQLPEAPDGALPLEGDWPATEPADGQAGPAELTNPQAENNAEGIVPATATGEIANAALPHPGAYGPQTPTLLVEKIAPASVNLGEPVQYEIAVRNTGSVAAHEVVVDEELPQGARLLSAEPEASQNGGSLHWELDTLGPGEERRLAVQVTPLEEGEFGSVARVTFQAVASARTRVTRPQLALSMTGPEEVLVDDPVTFNMQVSNPGTGDATGVMLHVNVGQEFSHPDGPELEYEIGTLGAGETRDIELTLMAARTGRGRQEVLATGDGQLEDRAEAYVNIVAPQLAVDVTGPKRRYLGRPGTYTVTVNNPGTAPASDIILTGYVPEGMDFMEATDNGSYDDADRAIRWRLAELGAGESANVQATLMPLSPGEMLTHCRATAARGLEAEADCTTLVEGVPAILLEVVDIDDPIEVGAGTVYEVRVVNQGTRTATNVRVAALVPSQLKVTGTTGPTEHRVEGDQVIFEPIPKLGPRADTGYRIQVVGENVGDVRFTVQLQTDQMATPVTEEESTRVYSDQ